MMRRFSSGLVVLATVASVAACGNDVPPPDKLDELAWMDTMTFAPVAAVASPVETGLVPDEEANAAPEVEAPRTATPVRRASSTPRRSASSGTYTPAPAPAPARTETVRHTARDAAIGAAGGAVIGAVAGGSRHRVKGAIIGAAAGAVIGGVIGHTVDTEERVVRY